MPTARAADLGDSARVRHQIRGDFLVDRDCIDSWPTPLYLRALAVATGAILRRDVLGFRPLASSRQAGPAV
jgi:hypothetical protein